MTIELISPAIRKAPLTRTKGVLVNSAKKRLDNPSLLITHPKAANLLTTLHLAQKMRQVGKNLNQITAPKLFLGVLGFGVDFAPKTIHSRQPEKGLKMSLRLPPQYTEPQTQLQIFADRLPKRPYCADELGNGLRIYPKHTATRHRYIQHDTPALVNALVMDLDRPDGWYDYFGQEAGVAFPNLITVNPKNSHAHALWLLQTPVCKSSSARLAPLRYLNAIRLAYTSKLRADRGYAGLITKNPLNPSWDVLKGSIQPYTLDELADWVSLKEQKPEKKSETSGVGRNVSMFDSLRAWAYRHINERAQWDYDSWHQVCLFQAEKLNTFSEPLPYSELRAIAKSVARFVIRNMGGADTFRRYVIETHTPERQRARRQGKRKADRVSIQASIWGLI